jgi:hypothetical protein
MSRWMMALALGLAVVAAARSHHFVFVVPDKGGGKATVVFSDSLEVDEDVAKFAAMKLTVRDAAGKDAAASCKAGADSLEATLPGSGPRVVFGSAPYGVMEKKGAKPFLLVYHPKALVGGASASKDGLGKDAAAELLLVEKGGKARLKLLTKGKPVAGAEVTLLKPDGGKAKLATDKEGLTEPIVGAGRFGAWARYVEAASGEHGGKKYEEVRHYPTLVWEAGDAKAR